MSGEKIEAQFTAPSVAIGIGSGATASTNSNVVAAGSYFMSGASGWLATLQATLNQTVGPYPQTATALQNALGYGQVTAGYLFQEASGNPVAAFGAPASLTAAGAPTYRNVGSNATGDYAVGFSTVATSFAGGDVFDPAVGEDLVVAWVGKFTNASVVSSSLFSKWNGGVPRWVIWLNAAGKVEFVVSDNVNSATAACANTVTAGEYHVGIAVLDRAANQVRVGIRTLSGVADVATATSSASVGSLASATAFQVGQTVAGLIDAATNFQLSALYIGSGAAFAASMSANLATALTNFANAINSSFTVALSSTTGLVTISNSFWPAYVQFGDATSRDAAGYAIDFDYPSATAPTGTMIGGGAWSAGYKCDEASGNLSAAYGTPATLTNTGALTYSLQGARGGADKAIQFTSAGNQYFDSGSTTAFDVGASDDLVVAWVGQLTAAPSGNYTTFSKVSGGFGNGWAITSASASTLSLYAGAVAAFIASATITSLIGHWHVGLAVIDRSTGKMRIGLRSLLDGTTSMSAETACNSSFSNAATFRVGASAWTFLAEPAMRISAFYIGAGAGYGTGLSAGMSTALATFAAYQKSQTGTVAPAGVWFPHRNFVADSDPKQAPKGDNSSAAIAPTGDVYSVAGTTYYRHRNARFPKVAKQYVWANDATVLGADWQTFYLETQLGQHSWFTARSRVKVYWDNGGTVTELGSGGVVSWKMPSPTRLDELVMPVKGWTGLVDITLGDLYSSG